MSDPIRMTAKVDFIDEAATPPAVKKGAGFTVTNDDDARRLEHRDAAERAPAEKSGKPG